MPYSSSSLTTTQTIDVQETNGGTILATEASDGSILSVSNRGYYEVDCAVLPELSRPTFVLEKHIAVIRKGPTTPPLLEMFPYEEGVDDINSTNDFAIIDTSFLGSDMHKSSNFNDVGVSTGFSWNNTAGRGFDGEDISAFYSASKVILAPGEEISIPIDIYSSGEDWKLNDQLVIKHEYTDSFGSIRTATARIQIKEFVTNSTGELYSWTWVGSNATFASYIKGTVMSITGNFPLLAQTPGVTSGGIYNVSLVQNPAIFETKFPKFSYRYKYEDGEYSVFGPWSEVAFIPSEFDYMPKKGYNLGMQNRLRSLNIKNWVPKNIPNDVIQVDILYKESNSTNIYTLSSHKKDDLIEDGGSFNYWNSPGNGGNKGNYTIKSELIHKVVASNQMLRPWDNVPRVALAQEITANRLIFANYVQNFDLKDNASATGISEEVQATFATTVETNDFSIDGYDFPGLPTKSLKSMRTYQLGVVYRDRYGRETPVLTSQSGSIKLPKINAKLQNRLSVELTNNPPYWAESYTFYIKETSNEYYNLAMDRWYDAEDGGIWLSFPSSERNKITDRTNLILKKQHDTHVFTDFDTTYKVLSIKDNAPTFIKTMNKYWGSLPMMLPPPGWGVAGKPGGWDSGMFYNTGLPLPNRMFLDIFAEYWDQSPLAELSSMAGGQIRIVQSTGGASSYSSVTSDTTNKTRWYDIAKITRIGSPPQTELIEVGSNPNTDGAFETFTTTQVEVPGGDEQLVRISLEKTFGDDALFCEPTSMEKNLSLSRGLSLEARTKIVRDKSEFEGRFFVKVLRDANVELNVIQPQQEQDDQYQILFTKRISYICAAHPGIQDWSNQAINSSGTILGANTNYIPVGVNTSKNAVPSRDEWVDTGINKHLYNITEGVGEAHARLVSSLSRDHANKGAGYMGLLNGFLTWQDEPRWPFGPGDATIGGVGGTASTTLSGHSFIPPYNINYTGVENYYLQTPSHRVPDGGGQGGELPYADSHVELSDQDWPSTAIDFYCPYSLFTVNSDTIANLCNSTADPYGNRVEGNITLGGATRATLSIADHTPYTIDPANPTYTITSTGPSDSDNSYLYGINPYQVPAIWGNQEDFLKPSPTFDADTFEKLSEDWYYLWYGHKQVHYSWLFAGFTPDRWFIDKVGAAQGGSGNGIWDNGTNGFMDLSYWGTGHSYHYSSLTEDPYNQMGSNEFGFRDAIETVGTQFRFKHDPDQVVYTIIKSTKNEHPIYNYEAPQGYYGDCDGGVYDSSCIYTGGYGLGTNNGHPSHSIGNEHYVKTAAFVSDLFNVRSGDKWMEKTGGTSLNRRVRWTLQLDKIIGAEGVHGFHPITNAVDADGKSVVLRGTYQAGMGPTGHVTPEKGGTPFAKHFFNLASYWNSTNGNLTGGVATPADIVGDGHGETWQPDDMSDSFYTDNPFAYIGLHERGLTQTEIQIITPYRGEERDIPMTNNPAIWETEPLEDVGLDIYYAASPTYPISLTRFRSDSIENLDGADENDVYDANWYDYSFRGEEIIKVGSVVNDIDGDDGTNDSSPIVCDVQGDTIWLTHEFQNNNGSSREVASGQHFKFTWRGEGTFYGGGRDDEYIEMEVDTCLSPAAPFICYKLKPNTHNKKRTLSYFNCWSYGTGVETNRLRDDYNAITIDKGVKASMPLATPYEEERRVSGLIFSGIYNSTSGVNELNQFIQAEPITKDLNPINGSIQKLYARDTDLVTFCENKVFRILANKDALFNAGGNSQLTSSNRVLGQTMPFSGEFGISKNPESFASESYRVYFTDRDRGAVLRLSKDGLTPISDAGMTDWFKDNFRFATSLIGSYDSRDDQYNLTIETSDQDGLEKAYTLSYTEARGGWVSFKSFIQQSGISHKNTYYTTPSNKYGNITSTDPWDVPYAAPDIGMGEMWQHSLDLIIKRLIIGNVNGAATVNVDDNVVGTIVPGMYVEGNGIPIDTTIISIGACNGTSCAITLSNNCFLKNEEELTFTTARNSFYDIPNHYSMVKTLFNGDQGTVKRFKTLDYEGTQAKTIQNTINQYKLEGTSVGQIYYDNYPKKGWYVENIETDIQEGKISEFIDKENKWFNYVRGFGDAGINDSVDTGEFSLQGLGFRTDGAALMDGCIDPAACNYDPTANTDDGSCYYGCIGCTDPLACNYDPNATIDSGLCWYGAECVGCTDDGSDDNFPGRPNGYVGAAMNYDASATIDDGSCQYCVYGCMDPLYQEYDAAATCDDNSCAVLIVDGCMYGDNLVGDQTWWDASPYSSGPISSTQACNYNQYANNDDGSCLMDYGCTNPLACNYAPAATCDDGSCLTAYGCMEATANNYDANATCSDGSCTYDNPGCTLGPNTDFDSCNYDSLANTNDGSCNWVLGCMDDGFCTIATCGFDSPNTGVAALNYLSTSAIYNSYNSGIACVPIIDPFMGYDNVGTGGAAFQLIDTDGVGGLCWVGPDGTLAVDGSQNPYPPCCAECVGEITSGGNYPGVDVCIYPNPDEGCMDWYACNYDPNATINNNSCEYCNTDEDYIDNYDDGGCDSYCLHCGSLYNDNNLTNQPGNQGVISMTLISTSSTAVTWEWTTPYSGYGGCTGCGVAVTSSYEIQYKLASDTAWLTGSTVTPALEGSSQQVTLTVDGSGTGCLDFNFRIRHLCANSESAWQYMDATTECTACPHAIGDSYQGGIIFYIDDPYDANCTGLISSLSDQSTGSAIGISGAEWGCYGTAVLGTWTGVGYGDVNTDLILGIDPPVGHPCLTQGIAADLARDYTVTDTNNDTWNDWFLPSKDELNLMYSNKSVIEAGGDVFANDWYWSSSEISADNAFIQHLDSGTVSGAAKDTIQNTRVIRKFPSSPAVAGSCPHEIGDTHAGGMIFYIDFPDDESCGGLVAHPTTFVMERWAQDWSTCYGDVMGAFGTGIGDGSTNSAIINANCAVTGTAIDTCNGANAGGYYDWFLPSKDEFNLMANELWLTLGYWTPTPSTSDYAFWTSTEHSGTEANAVWFTDTLGAGAIYTVEDEDKAFGLYMKPVRAF